MGEYANFRGERIKIGTCESMYYLRADQAQLVEAQYGNVDPVKDREEIRFRFPFPDEDHLEPGTFEDYDRGVTIPGWSLPPAADGFGDHYSVQFTSTAGYVLSIPCPEQFGTPGLGPVDVHGVAVHRNGFRGGPVVKAQRWVGEDLVTIVGCGACGAMWRLPLSTAEEVAVAFRSEADRTEWLPQYEDSDGRRTGEHGWELVHGADYAAFLHTMADRILAGYKPAEVLEGVTLSG